MQRVPPRHRLVPRGAFRRIGAALHVVDRGLVDRHHAGAGAGLDRHVAQRHAAFHRQGTDRRAAEFQRIAGAAGGADLADDGERDVLRRHAFSELAFDLDQHGLRRLLPQALRGQHVLDLGGADAECQCAERAVGRGMRVTAHHSHAGQGQPLFGADDVDDALADVVHPEFGDTELGAVGVERLHLQARYRVGDALAAVGGRHVVVGHGDGRVNAARRAVGQFQPLERLRAGDFVHQMAVDVEQRGAVGLDVHDVGVPQLLK